MPILPGFFPHLPDSIWCPLSLGCGYWAIGLEQPQERTELLVLELPRRRELDMLVA